MDIIAIEASTSIGELGLAYAEEQLKGSLLMSLAIGRTYESGK